MATKRTLNANQRVKLTLAMAQHQESLAAMHKKAAARWLSGNLGFPIAPDSLTAIAAEIGIAFTVAPRSGEHSPWGRARRYHQAAARVLLECARIAKAVRTDADFAQDDLDTLARVAAK